MNAKYSEKCKLYCKLLQLIVATNIQMRGTIVTYYHTILQKFFHLFKMDTNDTFRLFERL